MPHLLAAAESDPSKLIVFGVFIVVWVISSIMSAFAKKREQERRLRVRESIQPSGILPPQLPLPTPAKMKTPPLMLRRIDTPQRQKSKPSAKQPKSRRKSAGPPPLRVPQPPVADPARTPIQAASPLTGQVRAAQPASASASTLRSWMRPATMRQQFILTEILQPPITLR